MRLLTPIPLSEKVYPYTPVLFVPGHLYPARHERKGIVSIILVCLI
jgi:hypothetical protein